MYPSFVTGSQAYGDPRPDSDLNLVVLGDAKLEQGLRLMSEPRADGSICFGKLNLIVCTSVEQYNVWKKGTEELRNRWEHLGPVSRDEAVLYFANLWEESGLVSKL